jgi:hypothetical protein
MVLGIQAGIERRILAGQQRREKLGWNRIEPSAVFLMSRSEPLEADTQESN